LGGFCFLLGLFLQSFGGVGKFHRDQLELLYGFETAFACRFFQFFVPIGYREDESVDLVGYLRWDFHWIPSLLSVRQIRRACHSFSHSATIRRLWRCMTHHWTFPPFVCAAGKKKAAGCIRAGCCGIVMSGWAGDAMFRDL
jgi:hypothetical protein